MIVKIPAPDVTAAHRIMEIGILLIVAEFSREILQSTGKLQKCQQQEVSLSAMSWDQRSWDQILHSLRFPEQIMYKVNYLIDFLNWKLQNHPLKMQMKIFLNQILFCQFGRNLAITRCAPSWLQCTDNRGGSLSWLLVWSGSYWQKLIPGVNKS